jgi:transcriptional regulator with XRE-family HTH domain
MINTFIKKTRIEKKLSKSFMADKLDLSRPTYEKVENGKRELTYKEMEKLASIFEMPVNNLIKMKDFEIEINVVKDKSSVLENEMRINTPQKNIKKLKEVLLYILVKVGNKPNVGESVINKLLYFIDFDYYEKYEKQLIGATYIKNHFGPTPVELKMVLKDMEDNNEIVAISNKIFDFKQIKFIPLRKPNLEILNAQELTHIDEVLERLSDKNAKEISEYSHGDIP